MMQRTEKSLPACPPVSCVLSLMDRILIAVLRVILGDVYLGYSDIFSLESPTPGRDNGALPFLVPNPFKQAGVNICVRVDYEDASVLEIQDLGGYQA